MKSIKKRLRKIFDKDLYRDRLESLKSLEDELTSNGIGCYFEMNECTTDSFTIDTGSHAIQINAMSALGNDITSELVR